MIYECNICGTKKPQFNNIGESLGGLLKNYNFPYSINSFETLNVKKYACTICGSSDRDRLFKLYFDRYIRDKKIKMLDFAPSDKLEMYFRSKKNIDYRSADLYIGSVDDKVDIQDMKIYSDGCFDFFICSHVLEHVKDDIKSINELNRILKPGGKGIVMSPVIDKRGTFDEGIDVVSTQERWRRFGQDDHVRLYDKKTFLERLMSSGFFVQQYTWRQLGIFNMLRYGISTKSVLYIVSKEE